MIYIISSYFYLNFRHLLIVYLHLRKLFYHFFPCLFIHRLCALLNHPHLKPSILCIYCCTPYTVVQRQTHNIYSFYLQLLQLFIQLRGILFRPKTTICFLFLVVSLLHNDFFARNFQKFWWRRTLWVLDAVHRPEHLIAVFQLNFLERLFFVVLGKRNMIFRVPI